MFFVYLSFAAVSQVPLIFISYLIFIFLHFITRTGLVDFFLNRLGANLGNPLERSMVK